MFSNKGKDVDKTGKLSPQDLLVQEIEGIEKGEEATCDFGSMYLHPFLVIRRDPETGKKYQLYQDSKGADGRPAGKRAAFWKTSNSKDIADWIVQRGGHRYEG